MSNDKKPGGKIEVETLLPEPNTFPTFHTELASGKTERGKKFAISMSLNGDALYLFYGKGGGFHTLPLVPLFKSWVAMVEAAEPKPRTTPHPKQRRRK